MLSGFERFGGKRASCCRGSDAAACMADSKRGGKLPDAISVAPAVWVADNTVS